jgi:tetratricopeptide (TPR) repeat protein
MPWLRRSASRSKRRRDVQLNRVDDLIRLIQDELKEGASEVFQRAVEILDDPQEGGIDAAIAYLEARRPSTLEIARRHAEPAEQEKEQRNRTLQALVLEAQLRETRLDLPVALELREQVAELAPDWFHARNRLGNLLQLLARYREAEPHSRVALALAASPEEEAIALNYLANLLRAINRLTEAEPLMRRALAIDEQSYGAEHPNVARDLWVLAVLLRDTDRLSLAITLMDWSIDIYQRFARRNEYLYLHWVNVFGHYRAMLRAAKVTEDEIVPEVEQLLGLSDLNVTLYEPIAPHLGKLLGPAKSVREVLDQLDRQYREQGKPAVWFLSLEQPAPHLDELLGPAPPLGEVLEKLDPQYRQQGKPDIWFLPSDEPISPHLDELHGPIKATVE